ncbi:MAG: hypothetical protein ACKN9V_02085, partial [Pseudomonadota bacterium]
EHDPFVDRFVLIQGDRTFTGTPKPLHFPNEDTRFDRFKHKIIIKNVELKKDPASPWENELTQRNISFSCINYLSEDVVYLSDVDEIISRNHWPSLLQRIPTEKQPIAVWLDMFNFYINYRLIEAKWMQPKLFLGKHFLTGTKTANDFRVDYTLPTTASPCGWHFSYLMTEEQIREKLNSFSHQEFNRPLFNNPKKIKDQLRKRRDLFKRGLLFEPTAVTESWPLDMIGNPFWKKYICSTEPPVNSLSDIIEDHLFWTVEFIRNQKNEIKKWVKRLLLTN